MREANSTAPEKALPGSACFSSSEYQYSDEGPGPDGNQWQNGGLCLIIPHPNFVKFIISFQVQNLAYASIKWCTTVSCYLSH